MAMISPGPAASMSTRCKPSVPNISVSLARFNGSVSATPGHLLTLLYVAVVDAAKRKTADVRRSVEVGHEHLQRHCFVVGRSGNEADEQFEERLEVGALHGVDGSKTVFGVGVHDGKFDLLFIRTEIDEDS